MTLPLARCQQRLLLVWGIGAGFALLVVALQIMAGYYGDRGEEAVKWLMTNLFPNLGVMVGAMAYSVHHAPGDATVNPLAFRTAWTISVFYLFLVALVLFLQPLSSSTPLQLLSRSSLFLAPVQGLVGTTLGVFFVSKQSGGAPAPVNAAAAPLAPG